MKCPFCSNINTKVVNSRLANNGESIRRRRECENCGKEKRFTTFETYERELHTVIKRDGSRVPYSRERALRGIEKACKKRPVTQQQIDGILSAIEREGFRGNSREIKSMEIGNIILKQLRGIDTVAYIRFASVYREFKTLLDFHEEIKKLAAD